MKESLEKISEAIRGRLFKRILGCVFFHGGIEILVGNTRNFVTPNFLMASRIFEGFLVDFSK